MRKLCAAALIVVLVAVIPVAPVSAQTLSQQVLALLTRVNSWTASNTFYDLRIPCTSIPADTDARLYADGSCNLYFNGTLIDGGGGGGTTPHNLLSSTHPDTVPASPTRGALVVADSTPAWALYQPADTGCFVQFNGTDTVCLTSGTGLTAVPSSSLTGDLPAISGAALLSLNASNLGSGTVPLARLSGITNTQIDAAAAIAYSKLALTGSILNADVNASAAIAYSKLNLTGSLVSTDLADGAVTMAKIAQAGATSNQVIRWNGSNWAPATLSTGGTVTSVGLSMPGIFSVANSPVTGSDTIAVTLASQTANRFWASPNGSSGAPTFRAMVNADLPASGVAAGTYASVTVNDRGVITAATATVDFSTQGNGTVPKNKGGTGQTTSPDDTTMVGSGAAWVITSLPSCTQFWAYSTTTNLFTCGTAWTTGAIVASLPMQVQSTWNNAGVNFNAFLLNITDTASTAASLLADFQVGGSSKWNVRKDGQVTMAGMLVQTGVVFASLGTPSNGTFVYCPDCTIANPCAGAGSGALAKRLNGVWVCD